MLSRRQALVASVGGVAALSSIGLRFATNRDHGDTLVPKDEKLKAVSGDELLAQMGRWLGGFKRPAWQPIVKKSDGPPAASKFSGLPWLSAEETWPLCGTCQCPIHLFLQLNLAELPAELDGQFGTGLFQFFFCTAENCWVNSGGDHFSPTYLLRIVNPADNGHRLPAPEFNDDYPKAFPARTIIGWKKVDDYPDLTEFGGLFQENAYGVGVNRNQNNLLRVEHRGLGIAGDIAFDDYQKLDRCIPGDKLGGWPNWVQVRTEYPTCPECNKPMQTIVFSLEGASNIPFEFADGGRGHIAQCAVHRNVFGFAWQSG